MFAVITLQRDGTLRRARQPVNTVDPYKSLLKPLYNYDHSTKTRMSSLRDRSLASVLVETEDESEN